MVKSFRDFFDIDVSAAGFTLGPKDAHDAAKNINYIFLKRCAWFSTPKPIHILELREAYKELVPAMEQYYPGVIDKIFHPTIVSRLGYEVDSAGMVHWSK